MKKVDIIRPGSINAIIGPVGTLKRMLKNQEYFNSRGYQITVFTNESIQSGPIIIPPPAVRPVYTWKSKLRKKIGSIVKMKARSNSWIAEKLWEKEMRQIEDLIDYYISLGRTPDIVQFHSNMECYYYLRKRKDFSAKTVMFLHSDGIPYKMTLQYYPTLDGSEFLKKRMNEFDWTVRNVDRIMFIAKVGQWNFLNLYPNRTLQDTGVIINGIDDLTDTQHHEVQKIKKESEKTPYKYRMCCTGTINSRKGHRIIIEALRQMSDDILKQVHVDFVGDGSERPILEDIVREYGLEKHITFHGMIPNDEVYRYLAHNNIFILMSKNEGLPISIIEAMRISLPIISTNVSGIPELVKVGYNGFLLNPNEGELTALFNKLPDYNWSEMGNNSRIRFENEFTFERMRKEFCDMFDEL